MRLVIFTEPQNGATFAAQLSMAKLAEDAGFDGWFRSDHYRAMTPDPGPGPTDSWVTLGAIAAQTSRIRLGTLVTSATFRLPGPLAISVAQVDEMSGGRVELGLGAGWFEAEHTAYGIPFPSTRERFDRLEEQLEIIDGLWTTKPGETYAFAGTHYSVSDSPALPKPVQSPRPPIIIGGKGAKRTPALAARFADEFNAPFLPPAEITPLYDRVSAASAAIGRPAPTFSAAVTVVCGRTDAEVRRRAEASGNPAGAATGSPAAVVDRLQQYVEAGATRLFLQVLDLTDLDHISLLASDVAPHLARL
jgi:F420-dependent oxidoreductase-like protein